MGEGLTAPIAQAQDSAFRVEPGFSAAPVPGLFRRNTQADFQLFEFRRMGTLGHPVVAQSRLGFFCGTFLVDLWQ